MPIRILIKMGHEDLQEQLSQVQAFQVIITQHIISLILPNINMKKISLYLWFITDLLILGINIHYGLKTHMIFN